MLHRSSRASLILWPLLLTSAACSKRNLDLGDGMPGGIGGPDGGPVTKTDGGPSDGPVGPADGPVGPATDGPVLPPDARIKRLDATESGCVAAAILLPWTQTSGAAMQTSCPR